MYCYDTNSMMKDNPMNQKVVVRMLGKYGHQITIANDGREAVSTFEASDPNNRFECILMDIQVILSLPSLSHFINLVNFRCLI